MKIISRKKHRKKLASVQRKARPKKQGRPVNIRWYFFIIVFSTTVTPGVVVPPGQSTRGRASKEPDWFTIDRDGVRVITREATRGNLPCIFDEQSPVKHHVIISVRPIQLIPA